MKTKMIGLVTLLFAFTLMAAQRAVADGIHGSQGSDFDSSHFDSDAFHSPVHADALLDDHDRDDQIHQDHGPNTPTFDHILAHSFSPKHDHDGDDPAPTPEPSSLLLMAAGLTPFLWMRRRNGGL